MPGREKRSRWDPSTAEQPLQWGNLTEPEKQAVQQEMNRLGHELPGRASALAESSRATAAKAEAGEVDLDDPSLSEDDLEALRAVSSAGKTPSQVYISKARRQDALADDVVPGDVPMSQAVQSRVDLYRAGMRGNVRAPGEVGTPGADWYFRHGDSYGDIPGDVPRARKIAAGSTLSAGVSPDQERAAIQEIIETGETGKASKKATADRARGILQGEIPLEQAQDPVRNPKTWSYTKSTMDTVGDTEDSHQGYGRRDVNDRRRWIDYSREHRPQTPTTPLEQEVADRHAHLAAVDRGSEIRGQGTLPLYGELSPRDWTYTSLGDPTASEAERASGQTMNRHRLQRSAYEQGHIIPLAERSPQPIDPIGHTPADTWERAITTRHLVPTPALQKAAADHNIRKTRPSEEGGARESVGLDPAISTESYRHAAENEATRRAGMQLKEEYGADFDVTPGMVQPVTWTAMRREVPTLQSPKAREPGVFADPGDREGVASADTPYNVAKREDEKVRRALVRETDRAERQERQDQRTFLRPDGDPKKISRKGRVPYERGPGNLPREIF